MNIYVVYEKIYGGSIWYQRPTKPVAAFTNLKTALRYANNRELKARNYWFSVKTLKLEHGDE